jgi:hypothetical protein
MKKPIWGPLSMNKEMRNSTARTLRQSRKVAEVAVQDERLHNVVPSGSRTAREAIRSAPMQRITKIERLTRGLSATGKVLDDTLPSSTLMELMSPKRIAEAARNFGAKGPKRPKA